MGGEVVVNEFVAVSPAPLEGKDQKKVSPGQI